jgi:hypothetical protein
MAGSGAGPSNSWKSAPYRPGSRSAGIAPNNPGAREIRSAVVDAHVGEPRGVQDGSGEPAFGENDPLEAPPRTAPDRSRELRVAAFQARETDAGEAPRPAGSPAFADSQRARNSDVRRASTPSPEDPAENPVGPGSRQPGGSGRHRFAAGEPAARVAVAGTVRGGPTPRGRRGHRDVIWESSTRCPRGARRIPMIGKLTAASHGPPVADVARRAGRRGRVPLRRIAASGAMCSGSDLAARAGLRL